jgi:hypothetical protein
MWTLPVSSTRGEADREFWRAGAVVLTGFTIMLSRMKSTDSRPISRTAAMTLLPKRPVVGTGF